MEIAAPCRPKGRRKPNRKMVFFQVALANGKRESLYLRNFSGLLFYGQVLLR